MYEPNPSTVENRDALHAVMRAHRLAAHGEFKPNQNRYDADKLSVLNNLNDDPESESQVMTQRLKTHALGGTA